ncbi:DUF935 family protein (plasmid) [Verrucomicrobiaceae bacterium 227]
MEARDSRPSRSSRGLDAIVAPKARDRLFELIEREQLPGDVRDTLAGALTGDIRRQQLLFQAMIDTWPRLQKNLSEVFREVKKAPWEFTPFALRGKEADKSAMEKAELAEDTFWSMQPRAAWNEKGGPGLIESLAYGYFAGHQVVEVRWIRDESGIRPRAAKVVSPRFYGYPYDDHEEDRLMFNRDGGLWGYDYEDFPEHHFLLAINGGHPGHAAVAAPLRALTGYWLAATFGLKWLLQFAQLYGVPFRFATYADISDREKVCQMLETIGSAGWGAFPSGTKVEFVDASKSASALPQKDLIEMADTQCDTFILGQTLTTDVGESGSRALGDVHQDVRSSVLQGVADFVADVLNEQYLPSLIELNYGERSEVPAIKAIFEKPKNEQAMAERDRVLFKEMGLPVEKSWLYERHGVPMPDEDSEELFQPGGGEQEGDPDAVKPNGKEEESPKVSKGKVAASDQAQPTTLDELSSEVLENLTGVTKEWLRPVRPTFERLAALAMSKQVSDEDFIGALDKAQREMPELFDRLDSEVLEKSFTEAIGSAMIAGSVSRYES